MNEEGRVRIVGFNFDGRFLLTLFFLKMKKIHEQMHAFFRKKDSFCIMSNEVTFCGLFHKSWCFSLSKSGLTKRVTYKGLRLNFFIGGFESVFLVALWNYSFNVNFDLSMHSHWNYQKSGIVVIQNPGRKYD